jgi:hypothetical protein
MGFMGGISFQFKPRHVGMHRILVARSQPFLEVKAADRELPQGISRS